MELLLHPLTENPVEQTGRRFRVLGEPGRIRPVDQLRDEFAAVLAAGQQNSSRHLSVLAEAGMLALRKDGNHVHSRIVDDGVLGLCRQVCGTVEQQLQTPASIVTGAPAY